MIRLMKRLIGVIQHPYLLFAAIWARIGGYLPNSLYLRVRFYLIFKYKLSLDNPRTFNEKLNWLKIFYQKPEYVKMVDKFEVKSIVDQKLSLSGNADKCCIISTYGIWNSFDEIDFDSLPDSFVLKATNGRGGDGVIICKDKSKLDKTVAKRLIEHSMKANWRIEREWVYRDIKPRILAEQLLENNNGEELVDYKFMCFNGEPKLLFFASDRYNVSESLKFDWYDINLNHLPVKSVGYENSKTNRPDVKNFDSMVQIAKVLSEGMPHVRIDLYSVNGKIYFGEYTFFHDAGMVPIEPLEWDYKFGDLIKLPSKYVK